MDILRDVGCAIATARKNMNMQYTTASTPEDKYKLEERLRNTSLLPELLTNSSLLQNVELIAVGGQNDVWLFKLSDRLVQ